MQGEDDERTILSSGRGNNQSGGNNFVDITYIRSIEGILRIAALVSIDGTWGRPWGRPLATFQFQAMKYIVCYFLFK